MFDSSAFSSILLVVFCGEAAFFDEEATCNYFCLDAEEKVEDPPATIFAAVCTFLTVMAPMLTLTQTV